MEQYIPKSALAAEIEKYYKEYLKKAKIFVDDANYWMGKADAYRHILTILDTLEVKEVDLEREMQAFAKMELEPLEIHDANIGISITMSQLYSCAKHFFELGLKAQKL